MSSCVDQFSFEISVRSFEIYSTVAYPELGSSFLINAFSKVLDIPEDKLRIYYLGVQEKFEFSIDDLTIEKLNSLEKWTMIEKNIQKLI